MTLIDALATSDLWEVAVGLIIAVAGALIATAISPVLPFIRKGRDRFRLDAQILSIGNLVFLFAGLALYELHATRSLFGPFGSPTRTTLGTVVVVQFGLVGVDRWRLKFDACSVAAPFAAALTTAIYTASRGSEWGTFLALVTAGLFLVGYCISKPWGWQWFGVGMCCVALVGCAFTEFGFIGAGECFMILGGIIAVARSIAALAVGTEDRKTPPPPPPEAPPEPPPVPVAPSGRPDRVRTPARQVVLT